MNGVTSSIRHSLDAGNGVNFGFRGVLGVRSLCGMQTTGNQVTPLSVIAVDAQRMSSDRNSSVSISGGPELNCRFQASCLPEE
ncbi:hypothetical protein [Streptomyces sp. NPDC047968]|uniref:hypothetical protein n=1 Tax=unclassified Streptomyces TaxID=2593676 RepID=UPI003427DE39